MINKKVNFMAGTKKKSAKSTKKTTKSHAKSSVKKTKAEPALERPVIMEVPAKKLGFFERLFGKKDTAVKTPVDADAQDPCGCCCGCDPKPSKKKNDGGCC
jgi:hypothetical protein